MRPTACGWGLASQAGHRGAATGATLSSGMSAPHRMQDLTDVMRLIGVAHIPRDFAEQLNPYVREKFAELWEIAQQADDD